MLQTTNRKLQQQCYVINRKESTKVAIMIEVTSRRMECTLLTSNYSQMPAVALQSKTAIISYFNNLQKTLENIPPQNIINYDETNLSDDPGRKKVAVKEVGLQSTLKES